MRCLYAMILMSGIIIAPAYGETSSSQVTSWPEQHIALYKKYKNQGAEAYVLSLEKEMKETFFQGDHQFLTKTLGSAFKKVPPQLPLLEADKDSIEISHNSTLHARLTVKFGEENIWSLNGKVFSTHATDTVQDIAQAAWKSLTKEYKLGPYPESEQTSFLNRFNIFIPQASAEIGTILAVLLVVAAIGAMVYFTNKTTKTAERAIQKVGESTAKGINRITGAAAGAIEKVGESAAKVGDHASKALDKSSELSDAAKSKIESIPVPESPPIPSY